MLKNFISRIAGDSNQRELARLQPTVEQINSLEPEFKAKSDAELRALSEQYRQQIASQTHDARDALDEKRREMDGETDAVRRRALGQDVSKLDKELHKAEEAVLDEILPHAFAAVREASQRTIGLRHFDVQLLGGMVLHRGKIAEMKTGEGKTLVATLPLYLNALAGHGAHLVTPNDYLSKVGAQWMGPIYHLLGVSVAVIQHESSFVYDPDYLAADDRYNRLRPVPRREAYEADITYGTNNEFGFDYLRDNMVWDISQCVQRPEGLHYAIVDEVDNILIDEARTPLIISGPAEESSDLYVKFAQVVRGLRPSSDEESADGDYTLEEKTRNVILTERGIERVEKVLGISDGQSLYDADHAQLTPYLDNALRAHAVYKKDRDYIVKNGEVIIVDEFTGRLMYGRRYSEGLHQAIEAKENVRVQRESLTYATITFQNYFRMYRKLGGMTGTAKTEEEEFRRIYNMEVVIIPTHRPMIRKDEPDVIYKNQAAKFKAVVDEIVDCHRQRGQPVLVGTVAIETSELLSGMLRRKGIPHNVLNAKEHEKEAGFIVQAGRSGAVTVATNMAGRGVDILLGGNPEGMAREALRKQGVDLTQVPAEQWQAALSQAEADCAADREKVLAAGGLHVIGTERHEARRIDNQLRGRAGRQGDIGSSRFYISLEDDLMRRFGGDTVKKFMDWTGMEEDLPLEHSMLSKSIEQAQVRVEGYNFDIRKHVLEYDDVVNKQRSVIYDQRRQILTTPQLTPIIHDMIAEKIGQMITVYLNGSERDNWDLTGLLSEARLLMPLPASWNARKWQELDADEIEDLLLERAEEAYVEKEKQLGAEAMRQAERITMLRAVDSLWVRHLTDLDMLREGIGLRAYGQQDPLVAYKKEAFEMYAGLLDNVRESIVRNIYRVSVAPPQAPSHRALRTSRDGQTARPVKIAPADQVGRNDPCPCGSGKKYKHCHGRTGGARPGSKAVARRQSAPQRAAGRGGRRR
jgi:preprotein translocase subunit SecA